MTQSSSLGFDEIFARTGVLGHAFSEKLAALSGGRVRMRGYLAPAGAGVLVLTREPAARGGEGGTDAGWPDDAVYVFPADGSGDFAPGRAIEVEGVLEHGPMRVDGTDANTLVRLREARWQTA